MTRTAIVILALLTFGLFSAQSQAALIAEFTPNAFVQGGTVSNIAGGSDLVGIIFDLGPDAGGPGAGTPIWDLAAGVNSTGGVLSNLAPDPRYGFTVTWSGLSLGVGSSFNLGFIDYDGYNGGTSFNGGGSTLLDGSEYMTLLFASGATSTAFLPAIHPNFTGVIQFLEFDDAGSVPAPGALALLGMGLLSFGLRYSKVKRGIAQ